MDDNTFNSARQDARSSFQRNTFTEKFPGQCEHILRLITERLHLCLDKRDGSDPADPDSWRLNSQEIESLATAMYRVNTVRQSLNVR